MKKILSLLMSVSTSLLLIGNDAAAFEGKAHRNITNQAITYMIEKEGFTPSCPAYPMIAEGAVAEDLPDEDMRSWFHFAPTLSSWYASANCDTITWAFAPGLCTAWIPLHSNTMSNEFNWPNAVAEAGKDAGWSALGHMLHLLEDMAVPAHTRNDPHPLYEPFEEEAANLSPVLPDGQPISVSSPQDLFQLLRDYSQSRYFSDDTCFHPDFPSPTAAHGDDNYFYDADGRKIAHKGRSYRWTGNWRDCNINTTIAQEQYEELGPIAVRYAVSLIKYYSNQTNTYPCQTSKNLILNGDCELNSVWGSVPEPMPTEFSLQSSEQAHGGVYSWKIGNTLPGGINDTVSNKFTVVEGKEYNVSLWVYPSHDWYEAKVMLGVHFYDYAAHGDWFAVYSFGLMENQWNHITFRHVAEESCDQGKLGIMYYAPDADDQPNLGIYLYFDDVSVTEAN